MKSFLFMLVSLLSSKFVIAQGDSTAKKSLFEQKAKTYQTVSLVSAGVGITCIAASAALSVSELNAWSDGPKTRKQKTAAAVGAIGFGSLLAGFGFYLASRSNKKKAKAIKVEANRVIYLNPIDMSYRPMPAVTIKFKMGK